MFMDPKEPLLDRSQMMRGTLEGCIVKIIGDHVTYGYEIVSLLQSYGFQDVKEGSIYPLLIRLEKKGVITSEYQESPLGPKRKYYGLTPLGEAFLQEFEAVWKDLSTTVENVLKGDACHETK